MSIQRSPDPPPAVPLGWFPWQVQPPAPLYSPTSNSNKAGLAMIMIAIVSALVGAAVALAVVLWAMVGPLSSDLPSSHEDGVLTLGLPTTCAPACWDIRVTGTSADLAPLGDYDVFLTVHATTFAFPLATGAVTEPTFRFTFYDFIELDLLDRGDALRVENFGDPSECVLSLRFRPTGVEATVSWNC